VKLFPDASVKLIELLSDNAETSIVVRFDYVFVPIQGIQIHGLFNHVLKLAQAVG